jgi:hypothetical protein
LVARIGAIKTLGSIRLSFYNFFLSVTSVLAIPFIGSGSK